jgi:hypothetical protein
MTKPQKPISTLFYQPHLKCLTEKFALSCAALLGSACTSVEIQSKHTSQNTIHSFVNIEIPETHELITTEVSGFGIVSSKDQFSIGLQKNFKVFAPQDQTKCQIIIIAKATEIANISTLLQNNGQQLNNICIARK